MRSALFLDFDGTLAAIVPTRATRGPLPGVPGLLADLADRVRARGGDLRPADVVPRRALGSPTGVTLAGLYGLERALRGPDHDAWASVIDQVVAEASATAPEGVYVEPKGLTVTIHWRRAPEQEEWVVAFAERAAAEHGLLVHPGRHERELRPPIDVDKGTVVRALADELAGPPGQRRGVRRRHRRPSRLCRAGGLGRPTGAPCTRCGSPPSTRRARARWRTRPTSPSPAPRRGRAPAHAGRRRRADGAAVDAQS